MSYANDDHVDAESLALHALGEDAGDGVAEHLAECPECVSTLAQLSAAVHVGRSTVAHELLAQPDPRVWKGIEAELELDSARSAPRTTQGSEPAERSASAEAGSRSPLSSAARRRQRVLSLGLAAALVGILATGGAIAWITRADPAQVIATAALDPLPDWGRASGSAVLEESEDGRLDVRVTLDAAVPAEGYREVWLLTENADELVSLGVLDGSTGRFTVPEGVDLDTYDVVDVSQEALDGDPAHSGTSIVRGSLSRRA